MVFNSFQFLYFFLGFISLWFFIPSRFQKYFLLAASYFFYMSWKIEYGLLLLFSTLVNYYIAILIEKNHFQSGIKKIYFVSGVLFNVALLVYFKYLDFIGGNISGLSAMLGFHWSWTMQNILLPVGISFFTFQAISYITDVYRKELVAEKNFILFALYKSFFPQLVAGPIERAKNLLPQFSSAKTFSRERATSGLEWVLTGLFRKMVVADNLGIFVDRIFDPLYPSTGPEYLLGIYAFMFQLYGDFSGYSYIALGLARIMGFELMENFRRPFLSASVREFWQRWHISLSSWVMDYIYIPLGGNRKGKVRTIFNRIFSMLVIGIWHGANVTMAVFGLINGVMIALGAKMSKKHNVVFIFKIFITFHLICIPFIYFRSYTVTQANHILYTIATALYNPSKWQIPSSLPAIGSFFAVILLLSDIYHEYFREKWKYFLPVYAKAIYYNILIFALLIFGVFKASQFIYFQF